MKQVIWILINCIDTNQANAIGDNLLQGRFIACYDVIPERRAAYFWPPLSGNIERVQGSLLIGVTIADRYDSIVTKAAQLHSDEVPFVGSIKIDQVNQPYYNWLISELEHG